MNILPFNPAPDTHFTHCLIWRSGWGDPMLREPWRRRSLTTAYALLTHLSESSEELQQRWRELIFNGMLDVGDVAILLENVPEQGGEANA